MTAPPPPGETKSETIARLRTEIARIEAAGAPGGSTGTPAPGPVTFGLPAIDGHLPGGGLAAGAVHEIIAGDGGMAATGLALALAARLFAGTGRRSWLWCRQGGPLYGPGLEAFGFDAEAGLTACGRSDREVLWAMEEGLASGAFTAVFGEVKTCDPRAGRRLALATRNGGVTAFVLRRREAEGAPSVAATRWRVRSVPLTPADLPGPPGFQGDGGDGYAWRLDLLRGAGAMPRSWRVLWRPAEARARPGTSLFTASCEDWLRNHGCEDEDGETAFPPGALSLAPPLSGGTVPQGEAGRRREAG